MNDDKQNQNDSSIVHAYWNYFQQREALDRYVKSNPQEAKNAINNYLTSFIDAANSDESLQDVLILEHVNATGLRSLGFGRFYNYQKNGSRNERVGYDRTKAVALSLLALQTNLDIRYNTHRGIDHFVECKEMFSEDFARIAEAYYTVKCLDMKHKKKKKISTHTPAEQTRMDIPSITVIGEITTDAKPCPAALPKQQPETQYAAGQNLEERLDKYHYLLKSISF